MGRQLAKESPVEAEYVMPMPDSGRSAALGYAKESKIPFEEGIVPNRFVGRTFILPQQNEPDLDDLPAEVREAITVTPVDLLSGALAITLRDTTLRDGRLFFGALGGAAAAESRLAH